MAQQFESALKQAFINDCFTNIKISGIAKVSNGHSKWRSASCVVPTGEPGPVPIPAFDEVINFRPAVQKLNVIGYSFKDLKALKFKSELIGTGTRWQLEYVEAGKEECTSQE